MNPKVLKLPKRYMPEVGKTFIYIDRDHEYCIINQDGFLFAIDNICPHQGASLGLGAIKGDHIICPLHQYEFNFKNGSCNISKFHTNTYEVELVDDGF